MELAALGHWSDGDPIGEDVCLVRAAVGVEAAVTGWVEIAGPEPASVTERDVSPEALSSWSTPPDAGTSIALVIAPVLSALWGAICSVSVWGLCHSTFLR
jgi:hypothetical protein